MGADLGRRISQFRMGKAFHEPPPTIYALLARREWNWKFGMNSPGC